MPYMVTFAIYIPQMLAYIPYMDPMGNGKIFLEIQSPMFFGTPAVDDERPEEHLELGGSDLGKFLSRKFGNIIS